MAAKKPRASGPSKTHAERLAKGETVVLVWLNAQRLARLDAIAASHGGNRRTAVEFLIDDATPFAKTGKRRST